MTAFFPPIMCASIPHSLLSFCLLVQILSFGMLFNHPAGSSCCAHRSTTPSSPLLDRTFPDRTGPAPEAHSTFLDGVFLILILLQEGGAGLGLGLR